MDEPYSENEPCIIHYKFLIIIINSCHSLWSIRQWNTSGGPCGWPVFWRHSMLSWPSRLPSQYWESTSLTFVSLQGSSPVWFSVWIQLAFFRVCPIHFHLHIFICNPTNRFVVFLSSSFEIFYGHSTLIICHKQQFIQIWSLLEICWVIFHVSQAYKRTDFTLVLQIFSLVFLEMFQIFHIEYNWLKTTLALHITTCCHS